MALAEARLTGRPGVAMVTRGPGAANAQIAVHTAYQDQTPLVLLIGLIPVPDRNRESFQEFDPKAWFGSTAKKVLVLDDPDTAAELVDDALFTAASGRPGPVVIGVPEDILTLPTASEPVRPRHPASPAISRTATEEFAAHVAAARQPLFVLGGDAWQGTLGRRMADWAAEAGVPICTDFRAYDAVPHFSEAYIGSLGYGRSDELARRFDSADLLVFVGAVRSDVLSDGYALGRDAKTVVVNPDSALLGHSGAVDLQIVSTVQHFVDGLPAATPCADRDWMTGGREAFLRFRTPAPHPDEGVDMYEAIAALEAATVGDAIVTFGAGNHAVWAQRFLTHEHPNSLVAPRNGAMGVGIPAAVAASLIFPERRVVSIAGDGCFMMNGQELATAVGYGGRVLVIVVDNGCFATIREHQEGHYPGRPSGTQLSNPDFAALGRAYGMHGERVERTADFAAALERALESPTGALLHVVTDPATRAPKTA